jgi:hypothetical protein
MMATTPRQVRSRSWDDEPAVARGWAAAAAAEGGGARPHDEASEGGGRGAAVQWAGPALVPLIDLANHDGLRGALVGQRLGGARQVSGALRPFWRPF